MAKWNRANFISRLSLCAFCITALVLIGSAQVLAQDSVRVDAATVLSDTARRPIGINANYLMDDDANRAPSRSLQAGLTEMGVKFLRYPGGEKSDAYLWSVPPFNTSMPTLARTGPGEWPSQDRQLVADDYRTFRINPLDFDEFITVCRQIGAEPVVVICYDSMYKPAPPGGTAPTRAQLLQTAVEWVRYANIARRYNVKYWEIGNETYQNAYNGTAPAATYASDLIEFSQAMKRVDPSIKIGANGSSSAWWQTIIQGAAAHIDFLVVHNYPCWNWGGYDFYRNNSPNLIAEVSTALSAINNYATPSDKERLKVAVTEMNSADWTGNWPHVNNLGHALVMFDTIGEQLRLPKLEFTQLWNTRWVNDATTTVPRLWDALDRNNLLNATGRAVAIWGQFLLDKMVSTTSTSMVRTYAAYSPVTRKLNIFLINKDYSSRATTVSLQNYGSVSSSQRWDFKGAGPEDQRPVWMQAAQPHIEGSQITLTLNPVSITVLSLDAATANVVLYAAEAPVKAGGWTIVADSTAAGGSRIHHPDAGAAKVTTPLANPTNFFEMTFQAEAGRAYRLWVRGKAQNDYWGNDSVFAQFSGSVNASGAAIYRIGTTSAADINLEDCSGCGLQGWGWQDNGWGVGVMGPLIYFAATGTQTIRVQTREDGLSIDQIVLSPASYLNVSPGSLKNDTVILPKSGGAPPPAPPTSREIVIWALDVPIANLRGNWARVFNSSAAGQTALRHPDAGAGKQSTPLASPTHYFEMTFQAEAGRAYRLWIRGRADNDYWGNDSVFAQFSGSVTSAGSPVYRIGTTSAADINLEDCSGCGLQGWGWQDNGWGVGVMGPLIYFAATGTQTIRVQTREDGLSIDQIVLSPASYLNASPGSLKNDTVILPSTIGSRQADH